MVNAYVICAGLLLCGVVLILSARWDALLSHISFFVAGTIFFMFPGALLKDNQLWYFRTRTEAIALSAILVSMACMALAYVLGVGTKKRVSNFPSRRANNAGRLGTRPAHVSPRGGYSYQIPTSVIVWLLLCCVLIKLFFDSETITADHFLAIPVGLDVGVWAKVLKELGYAPVAAGCLTPWLWRNVQVRCALTKLLMAGLVTLGVFSLSRTPAFYVLGTLLLFWLWQNHARWSTPAGRLKLLTGAVVLLPLMIFLGAFVKGSNMLSQRISGDEASENTLSDVFDFALDQQYKLATSDAYGNLLFAVDHYPNPYDYQPTLSIASIVTAVIPRAWMPSKGYTPSYVLTSEIMGAGTFERTGNSLATSFVGELWMNYGWIAVILGSFALGLLGAAFRRLGSRNGEGSYKHILFLMSLVAFFVTPRGDVFSTTLRGCTYIGMAWAIARGVIFLSRRAQFRQNPRMRLSRPIHVAAPNNFPCAS